MLPRIRVFATVLLALATALPALGDDEAPDQAVTCGSVMKIENVESGYYLNSENKNLNAGSGQQIVTFVNDPSTHNTLWWIRPANHRVANSEYPEGSTCKLAEPIKCGTLIRLTHQSTKRNLHSHGVESVLSKQQEVTAFGEGDGQGDGGDNWIVTCMNSRSKYWVAGESVRFKHQDTNKYLGTAKSLEFNRETCGHHCPLMNHLESFGRSSADTYSVMQVEHGIHITK